MITRLLRADCKGILPMFKLSSLQSTVAVIAGLLIPLSVSSEPLATKASNDRNLRIEGAADHTSVQSTLSAREELGLDHAPGESRQRIIQGTRLDYSPTFRTRLTKGIGIDRSVVSKRVIEGSGTAKRRSETKVIEGTGINAVARPSVIEGTGARKHALADSLVIEGTGDPTISRLRGIEGTGVQAAFGPNAVHGTQTK